MDFVRYTDSARAKLHMGGARLPVLVGVTAVALAALVAAGVGLASMVSPEGAFVIESAPVQDGGTSASAEGQAATSSVFVHVGGAVACPGVYELPEHARVQQAVDAAGGFAEDAAVDSLNLARVVCDGEQIIVVSLQDAQAADFPASNASSAPASGSAPTGASGGKININTATAETLQQLSGVGPSLSERIVADRQANGPFATVEELKRVSGIGDKKYASIADSVCVG